MLPKENVLLRFVVSFICLLVLTLVFIFNNSWKLQHLPGFFRPMSNLHLKHWHEENSQFLDYDDESKYWIQGLFNTSDEIQECKVPLLSVNPPQIAKLMDAPFKPINCTEKMPLMFEVNEKNELIQIDNPEKFGWFECCYRSFTRGSSDSAKVVYEKDCHKIVNVTTVIPEPIEFIGVACKRNEDVNSKYVDMFALPRQKIKNKVPKNGSFDVVILGLDSTSRLNFIRALPSSYKFLKKKLNAISMLGYNKVGDNTYPNVVATLTGSTTTELSEKCLDNKPSETHFDDCPFIWKNFSSRGYSTVFGEDAVWMGTFSYLRRGFKAQPTDYYLRTLTSPITRIESAWQCYGPRLTFTILTDYMKKISNAIDSNQRYFEFIWSASLFHDSARLAKVADPVLLNFLEYIKSSEKLKNAVFILMSDHGLRFGALRGTYQGKIEDRLPFVHFVFPDWFRRKYPTAVKNMEENKRRLTTPFDLHETLMDLAYFENIDEAAIAHRTDEANSWTRDNVPRAISMFLPVPLFRNCTMAGIPYQWCMCLKKKEIGISTSEGKEAGRALVKLLNEKITPFPKCSFLSLNELLSVDLVILPEKYEGEKRVDFYDVRIVTDPAGARFEATIKKSKAGIWAFSGGLSRTNLYGEQSHCVTDPEAKKFCFCYDLLEKGNSTNGRK